MAVRRPLSLSWIGSALALLACSRAPEEPRRDPPPPVRPVRTQVETFAPAPTKLGPASVEQRLPRIAKELSFLAFGGGSDPLSNQVSIAQDLELATSLLAGRGLTLFASGPQALLAVERKEPTERDVGSELAHLFGPPGAERVRYEPASMPIDSPATRDHVLQALRAAVESGTQPLFVIAAGHGEQGRSARENELPLWGGWPVSVEDVAEILDNAERPRPTRLLVTACYGGGFAELAFMAADPRRGARGPEHCGLFAAPWDDESSGCDPNPDRRKQESYALHFLSALRGEGRDGDDRLEQIDLDRDARVALSEAHAWARIHSRSFDVPTTTSERFLREYVRSYENERTWPRERRWARERDGANERAPSRGSSAGVAPLEPPTESAREGLPDLEESAVIRALSAEFELEDERAARAKLSELERILADAEEVLEEAQRASDDTFYALRIALLERWPLLEHPFEARTRALIEREGPRILQMLTDSELARSYALAGRELEEAIGQHDAVRVSRARVLRLVRAYETLRLENALRRRGGARFAHYQSLRRCERFVPLVRAPLRRAELGRQPTISPAIEAKAHAK